VWLVALVSVEYLSEQKAAHPYYAKHENDEGDDDKLTINFHRGIRSSLQIIF
jgi:hypothetical protein